MKKLQANMFLMLLAGLFVLTSCDKDDPTLDNVELLYGKWVTVHMKMTAGKTVVDKALSYEDEAYMRITFGEDGSFVTEELEKENLENGKWVVFSTGTYSVKGNKITTVTRDVDDEYEEWERDVMTVEELSGSRLVLSAKDVIGDENDRPVNAKLTLTLEKTK